MKKIWLRFYAFAVFVYYSCACFVNNYRICVPFYFSFTTTLLFLFHYGMFVLFCIVLFQFMTFFVFIVVWVIWVCCLFCGFVVAPYDIIWPAWYLLHVEVVSILELLKHFISSCHMVQEPACHIALLWVQSIAALVHVGRWRVFLFLCSCLNIMYLSEFLFCVPLDGGYTYCPT